MWHGILEVPRGSGLDALRAFVERASSDQLRDAVIAVATGVWKLRRPRAGARCADMSLSHGCSATVRLVAPAFLSLPQEAFEDLTALAAHPELVRAVDDGSEGLKSAASFAGAATLLAETTGADRESCRAVLRGLINLARLRRAFDLSVGEFLGVIDASVERASDEWKKETLAAWNDCKEVLASALNPSRGLSVFEKASRLGYSYANTLVGTELITDLRPVFDEDAAEIERMSTSFVLSLEFYEGGQNRSLDLALDLRDIQRLKKQCLRAETKAKTIKQVLRDQPWTTVVVGQDEDEGN